MVAIRAWLLSVKTMPINRPSARAIKHPPCQPASSGTEASISHSSGSSVLESRSMVKRSLVVWGSATRMVDSKSVGVLDQPAIGRPAAHVLAADRAGRVDAQTLDVADVEIHRRSGPVR